MSQQTTQIAPSLEELQKQIVALGNGFNEMRTQLDGFKDVNDLMSQVEKSVQQKEGGGFNASLATFMPNKSDLPLLIAGVGAGTSQFVVGLLQNLPYIGGLNPSWLQLLGGYLGYKFFLGKNNYVSAYFSGLVIGGVAGLVQTYMGGAAS